MNQPRRILAAAAVVALALTGCAHSATDAAVVDGVVVADSEFKAAAVLVSSAAQQPVAKVAADVLTAEIRGLVAEKIAASHNLTLTDAARAEIVSTNASLKTLQADAVGRTLVNRVADYALVLGKVGGDVFAAECASIPVQVNPRIGTWSKETCSFYNVPGSLSQPAATASPTNG